MNFDFDELLTQMTNAATATLGPDLTALSGFSQRQLYAMATQAKLLSEAHASGQLSSDAYEFLLNGLHEMGQNFEATLDGLSAIMAARVRAAVEAVLWRAVAGLTGLPLH